MYNTSFSNLHTIIIIIIDPKIHSYHIAIYSLLSRNIYPHGATHLSSSQKKTKRKKAANITRKEGPPVFSFLKTQITHKYVHIYVYIHYLIMLYSPPSSSFIHPFPSYFSLSLSLHRFSYVLNPFFFFLVALPFVLRFVMWSNPTDPYHTYTLHHPSHISDLLLSHAGGPLLHTYNKVISSSTKPSSLSFFFKKKKKNCFYCCPSTHTCMSIYLFF